MLHYDDTPSWETIDDTLERSMQAIKHSRELTALKTELPIRNEIGLMLSPEMNSPSCYEKRIYCLEEELYNAHDLVRKYEEALENLKRRYWGATDNRELENEYHGSTAYTTRQERNFLDKTDDLERSSRYLKESPAKNDYSRETIDGLSRTVGELAGKTRKIDQIEEELAEMKRNYTHQLVESQKLEGQVKLCKKHQASSASFKRQLEENKERMANLEDVLRRTNAQYRSLERSVSRGRKFTSPPKRLKSAGREMPSLLTDSITRRRCYACNYLLTLSR